MPEFKPTYYIAKVMDNDSQNSDEAKKDGRVQIYIAHLMSDFKQSQYPWARPAPLSTGGSDSDGTSFIPEKDSLLWVYFEDEEFFKKPYYIADVHLETKHPHELYEDNIKSNVNAQSSYPDVKYIYLKNGICLAISSDEDNPEITIYHPKAPIFIDKDGHIKIKASNKKNIIETSDTGIKITDKNNNEIIMDSSGIKIKTGDASIWKPCSIDTCLFTGAPHGGTPAGITKLTGG